MADRSAAYREALAGLREELAELEQRREKVTTSIGVIADLLGESGSVAAPPAPPVVHHAPDGRLASAPSTSGESGGSTPSKITIAEAAELVLEEAGRHQRALPITTGIVSSGLIEPENELSEFRASVGSVLAKNAKRNRIFTKPAKGVFGLVKWGGGPGPNETAEEYQRLLAGGADDDEPEVQDEQLETAGE